MPTVSRQQQKLMFAAANNPAVAKKVGVPQSVAQDFAAADVARGPKALPKTVGASKGGSKKK